MVVCDQSMDCSICHNQAVARLTVSFTLSFTNSHSLLVGGASQLPVQLPCHAVRHRETSRLPN